jgi:hypothetical protein
MCPTQPGTRPYGVCTESVRVWSECLCSPRTLHGSGSDSTRTRMAHQAEHPPKLGPSAVHTESVRIRWGSVKTSTSALLQMCLPLPYPSSQSWLSASGMRGTSTTTGLQPALLHLQHRTVSHCGRHLSSLQCWIGGCTTSTCLLQLCERTLPYNGHVSSLRTTLVPIHLQSVGALAPTPPKQLHPFPPHHSWCGVGGPPACAHPCHIDSHQGRKCTSYIC